VRLETLSSVQSAHDLDWLRRALAAPALNLIGSSYGTRIAAEAMRTVRAAIRAVAMDGPVPPGVPHLADDAETAAEVMGVLLARCVTTAACRRVYPEIEAEYDIVVARVRREPLVVTVPPTDRAPDGRLVIDERLLRDGFAQLLLTPELAAGVPLLIHALARDGIGVLVPMASRLMQLVATRDIAYGTHLAFHCNDAAADVAAPAWLHGRCVAWIGEEYGRASGEGLWSDIPTLIQTGEFDPRTPPSYANALAGGLARGHYVEMPWTGHSRPPDCAIRITRDFFDAPDRAPDATCMGSVPPVRFVADVVPSRWIRRAAMRADGNALTLAAPAGLAFVLLLVPLFAVPARRRHLRRAGLPPGAGRGTFAVRVAAATALLCLAATAAALYAGARTHPFVPALGVLEPWRWVLVLPWIVLALGVIAAVRSARADPQRLPAPARWSALAGIAIVIGTWATLALT
jgi:pimeloyl-ACP methyl ester carboxylesterase